AAALREPAGVGRAADRAARGARPAGAALIPDARFATPIMSQTTTSGGEMDARVIDLLVRRDDWRQTRVAARPLEELAPDQVLLRVDRFALTANNVTYALTGDMLGYWTFFPAEAGWGRIPVMGFADVVRSRHADVAVGERVFGFFPMSTHLVVDAGD